MPFDLPMPMRNRPTTLRRSLAALALTAVATTLACGGTDLEKATKKSQAHDDRPLVIMATAKWCGPCRSFKEYVLPSPQVQDALRDVQFVMLDEARSKGSLRRLGIRSYPTFIVVRPDQTIVAGLRGATSATTFVDFLKWGTPNWYTRTELEERLRNAPSVRLRVHAARWFAMHGDLPRAGKLYDDALADVPEDDRARRAELEWEILLVGSSGLHAKTFVPRAREFIATFPEAHQVTTAYTLVLLSGVLEGAERRAFGKQAVDALHNNPQALNGLIYDLLAADLPDVAVIAGKRQVELAPQDANAYDSLAEAYNYAGERTQAILTADKAIAKAPASDSRAIYEKNRTRFVRAKRMDKSSSLEQAAAIFGRYRIGR